MSRKILKLSLIIQKDLYEPKQPRSQAIWCLNQTKMQQLKMPFQRVAREVLLENFRPHQTCMSLENDNTKNNCAFLTQISSYNKYTFSLLLAALYFLGERVEDGLNKHVNSKIWPI